MAMGYRLRQRRAALSRPQLFSCVSSPPHPSSDRLFLPPAPVVRQSKQDSVCATAFSRPGLVRPRVATAAYFHAVAELQQWYSCSCGTETWTGRVRPSPRPIRPAGCSRPEGECWRQHRTASTTTLLKCSRDTASMPAPPQQPRT